VLELARQLEDGVGPRSELGVGRLAPGVVDNFAPVDERCPAS